MQEGTSTDTAHGAVRSSTKALALIIFAVSGFSFSMGMTYPVIALVLEAQGFSETEIGLNSAVAGFGLLASAFFIPQMAQRMTYRHVILISGVTGATTLVVMTQLSSFEGWAIARFTLALGVAGLFIGTEAWINELVEDNRRGLIIGIYASMVSATFALGPLMIPFIDISSATPFLLCAAVVILSGIVVIPLKPWDVTAAREESAALFPIFLAAPVVLYSILTMGMFEAAALSLLPIYALERGYSTDLAAWLVASLAIGSFLAQPIIGRLSDFVATRPLLFVCGCASTILCLAVPMLDLSAWYALALLAVLGGTTFGSYTLALVTLGRRFKGAALAAAMGCSAIAWGSGGIIGPAIAGPAMEGWGDDALLYVLAVFFALLVVFTLVRSVAQAASPQSPAGQ